MYMANNIFCGKSDLTNESSVEQFFVIRLLKFLGYKDSQINTKTSLKTLIIGKGSLKENYKPDYAIKINGKIRLIIETKEPTEDLTKYIYQPSNYCLAINQSDPKEDPARFFVLTNGLIFVLYEWNNKRPLILLKFNDFDKNNPKFLALQNLMSEKSITNSSKSP